MNDHLWKNLMKRITAGQKSDSICSLEITGKYSEKVSPIGWKMGSVRKLWAGTLHMGRCPELTGVLVPVWV